VGTVAKANRFSVHRTQVPRRLYALCSPRSACSALENTVILAGGRSGPRSSSPMCHTSHFARCRIADATPVSYPAACCHNPDNLSRRARAHNVDVSKRGQCVAALAALTAALAGCGGSDKPVTTRSAAPPTDPGTSSPTALTLPPSANGPTTCTVYESGYAIQVIFASKSFDVRAECRAWTTNRAGEGYLWGYQPARATAQPADSTQVCYLTDPLRNVAARVIEATGFRAVSAVEAARGSSACVSLLSIGWTKQAGRPTRRAAPGARTARFRRGGSNAAP
jgi:hypothetical protein